MKALKVTGSGYWMALPALLAILALVVYPLGFATYSSLRRIPILIWKPSYAPGVYWER